MSSPSAVDFLVETKSPEGLDRVFQYSQIFRAQVVGLGTPGGIVRIDGHVVVRVFSDPGFFQFACESQGYCRVIRKLEALV